MAARSSVHKSELQAVEVEAGREAQPLVPTAPIKRDALVCVMFAGLAGILLGYDVGMVAGVLNPIHNYFDIGHRRTEMFVGSLNAMAFIGCFLVSPLADKYGRRSTLGLAALLFFIGNSLQAIATSYSMLIFGRSVAGLAVGFTLILAPLYTAEISPARVRGTLTTIMEICFNVGIVLGFFFTWLLQNYSQDTVWRLIMGFGSVPALVLGMGTCFFMVESPRWLATQGRLTEAQAVLDKVMEPEESQRVLEQLNSASSSDEPQAGWTDLFLKPEFLRPLILGCVVSFFSQSTGIESVQYYSVHILAGTGGFERSTTLSITLIMGLVKLFSILFATFNVDTWGRRPLLMISGLGCGVSMVMLSLSADQPQNPMQPIGMMCFMVSFSLGYGPLLYVFNGEIFPQAVRSKGMSVSMSVARFMSATVSLTFLSIVNVLTLKWTWAIFASMGFSSVAFVFLCVPETRGKALEEAV